MGGHNEKENETSAGIKHDGKQGPSSNRRQSTTLQPLTPLTVPHRGIDDDSTNDRAGRIYSVTSGIVPQTLTMTHPDEEALSVRGSRSPTVMSAENVGSSSGMPKWSQVGFQSIFQNSGQRRSTNNLRSRESLERSASGNNLVQEIRSKRTGVPRRSTDSFDRSGHSSGGNNDVSSASSITNAPSAASVGSDPAGVIRKSSAFSLSTIKDDSSSASRRSSTGKERSSLNLFKTNSRKSSGSTSRLDGSLSLSSQGSASKSSLSPLLKMTKKIFHSSKVHHIKDMGAEPAVPNSLSKFLHSTVTRHRTPVQFIHNTTGGIIDSGKSVYSFNPSVLNTTNDAPLVITQQDDALDAANIALLHDLLRNLPSLEANFKNFKVQELQILCGNIWGIYCSVVIELFKAQRVWQLPAKIEDLNHVLRFYVTLETMSKVAKPHAKLVAEVEEFITTSLYVFENQIVFNYSNEETINTALKRLGVIWQVFYEQVYYDVMAVMLPLESLAGPDRKPFSLDYLLLRCFRDSIVLPYYQNFIHSDDGVSKSFNTYILAQEDENGVTEQDKLTLLQCFGILGTIQGSDRHQQVIEELLEGVRMSI
ncbi:Bit2p KNAG_0C01790 [Huiozyma naganishii CBS 8797]|uniref:Target of rapamycin complex 2 subunit BIT2 n=1 Tax=Huiozyma naganishii (strain ATCC MYA-139 / BCRC 22969 / CBS 8797 / KCTC 17520 / NBRC 10181 / NCYC 3082 / Yp74L-3) TaxID=1071383 RepID=J7RID5_HUIN7|nr:hypothetical protein KNAG_0C01790 [Kazachstania naganishii CBS 8797]CCK69293.1 hypothetical protein KNAG_0C01790 [Kazachstania naganishii CBS 8797]